jgi:hypothetical protein
MTVAGDTAKADFCLSHTAPHRISVSRRLGCRREEAPGCLMASRASLLSRPALKEQARPSTPSTRRGSAGNCRASSSGTQRKVMHATRARPGRLLIHRVMSCERAGLPQRGREITYCIRESQRPATTVQYSYCAASSRARHPRFGFSHAYQHSSQSPPKRAMGSRDQAGGRAWELVTAKRIPDPSGSRAGSDTYCRRCSGS